MNIVRVLVIVGYLAIACLPLAWMALTSIKQPAATISTTAKILPLLGADSLADVGDAADAGNAHSFAPTTSAYAELARKPAAETPEEAARGRSFLDYLWTSAVIGVLSTAATVALGTACAYGFSRFRIAGSKDWLFFILSTRFMPPLAVVAPVLMMYRQFGLPNTYAGLVILYTAFNLSLAVWLMKGFIDDIPRAYEEAALVDGYTRMQAFWRIIVPQARTGMAVTAVFCLISAWNEFGFAMTLNNAHAVTVPVYFAGLQGNVKGMPWPQIAAGVLVFVAPIVVFTVLVRHHLLRGVTFGTVKQ